jgi:tetratricopeptide (TPR) repeat protein
MKEPQELYQKFIDLGLNDFQATISLFEENLDYLESRVEFKDFQEFHYHIVAFTRYASSLEGVGRYRNSLEIVSKPLSLIEDSNIDFKEEIIHKIVYSDLLLIKGRCHFNLNEYKIASKYFKKLVLLQHENDYYMNWYKSSMIHLRTKYLRPLYITGLSLMLPIIFVPDLEHNTILIRIGLAMILVASGISFFQKQISDIWDGKTGVNK